MIKVFSNKALAFSNGEKDNLGNIIRVKTTANSFCTLPDWVERDEYYQLAVKDGSLQPFVSSKEAQEIEKGQETVAKLKAEIAELEARKKMAQTEPVQPVANPVETPTEPKSNADKKPKKDVKK